MPGTEKKQRTIKGINSMEAPEEHQDFLDKLASLEQRKTLPSGTIVTVFPATFGKGRIGLGTHPLFFDMTY
jgi:hypothetical protein